MSSAAARRGLLQRDRLRDLRDGDHLGGRRDVRLLDRVRGGRSRAGRGDERGRGHADYGSGGKHALGDVKDYLGIKASGAAVWWKKALYWAGAGIAGAVIGGVMGSALTGGSTVGTVAGAGAGAAVGYEIGKRVK